MTNFDWEIERIKAILKWPDNIEKIRVSTELIKQLLELREESQKLLKEWDLCGATLAYCVAHGGVTCTPGSSAQESCREGLKIVGNIERLLEIKRGLL